MAEELLEFSMKEADRLKVIWQVNRKQLKVRQACEQLGLSRRQILRICKRVKKEGNGGVIHRLRGRRSNHQLPEGLVEQAVGIPLPLSYTAWVNFSPKPDKQTTELRRWRPS